MDCLKVVLALFKVVVLSSMIPGALCGAEWTVMVYMNADNSLDGVSVTDFEEMAQVAGNPDVTIVVQHGRLGGCCPEDAEPAKTFRCLMKQDMEPDRKNAEKFEHPLGELNMGDPVVLKDFGSMGLAIYFPETKRQLLEDFLADHGYEKQDPVHPVEFVQEESWGGFLYKYLGIP